MFGSSQLQPNYKATQYVSPSRGTFGFLLGHDRSLSVMAFSFGRWTPGQRDSVPQSWRPGSSRLAATFDQELKLTVSRFKAVVISGTISRSAFLSNEPRPWSKTP